MSSFLTWKPPREVQDDFKFEFLGEDKDGHSGNSLTNKNFPMKIKL